MSICGSWHNIAFPGAGTQNIECAGLELTAERDCSTRILFKLRVRGCRLGPTDVRQPLLTSLYCPFNLLQSFKDGVAMIQKYVSFFQNYSEYIQKYIAKSCWIWPTSPYFSLLNVFARSVSVTIIYI